VRARARTQWPWWVAALVAVAVLSWLRLQGFAWNDYDEEASAAMRALIAGDVHGFLAQVPVYGGSLVLRAPFAGAVAALGGGELAVYRAVSIPCLVAVALLGLMLVRRMDTRGRSTAARALALGLCVANPVTLRALELGHPEELLCAALAIGAVLAAVDRRTILAAVLLGLAVATKSWAVLAIGPVLLALPARRLLALGIAGALTLAVLAPIMLAVPSASHGGLVKTATSTGYIFVPWQLFWFLGESNHIIVGGYGIPKPMGYRLAPEWLAPLTHPLIACLVVPLSLAWAHAHRAATRLGSEHVLLLLALLLLLRCVLDPWNTIYYELPFLLALLSWEALCRPERLPLAALAASALVWFTFETAPKWLSPDMQSLLFVAWALPLAAWMARTAFAPTAARISRRRAPDPAPRPIAAAAQH
jgi:hypothetical protein